MTFADLQVGAAVFLDANPLVFHFTKDPKYAASATDLLERIARGELTGITSTHVVCEMAHRLMTLEATQRLGWSYTGIASRLRKHPADVQQLVWFRQAIDEVPQFGIQVLAVNASILPQAATICQQTGLLTNDAVIVAVMQANGLTHLASNDPDFDGVPGLTRYAPA